MFVDENAIQTSEKPTFFTIQTIKKGINYCNKTNSKKKASTINKFNSEINKKTSRIIFNANTLVYFII